MGVRLADGRERRAIRPAGTLPCSGRKLARDPSFLMYSTGGVTASACKVSALHFWAGVVICKHPAPPPHSGSRVARTEATGATTVADGEQHPPRGGGSRVRPVGPRRGGADRNPLGEGNRRRPPLAFWVGALCRGVVAAFIDPTPVLVAPHDVNAGRDVAAVLPRGRYGAPCAPSSPGWARRPRSGVHRYGPARSRGRLPPGRAPLPPLPPRAAPPPRSRRPPTPAPRRCSPLPLDGSTR